MIDLKTLKDYTLMKGKLYCIMSGGILSRCVGQEKALRKLKEVHGRTCGLCCEINLYRRLQRVGFYQPSMGKDADLFQTQCKTCHLAIDREESYATFTSEDWRSLFLQYLAKGVLPQKHNERYKLKKLAVHYFYMRESFLRKDMMETYYDVWVRKKRGK